MGMISTFDPNAFELIERHDALDWMKRQLPEGALKASLFLYRAVESETFFVAQWISYRSVFVPLMAIGKNLAQFNQAMANKFLRNVVGPPSPQENAATIAKAESDYLHELETFENERTENRAKMYRDHFPDMPKMPDSGVVHLPSDILAG